VLPQPILYIPACRVRHLVVYDSLLAFAIVELASNRAGYELTDADRAGPYGNGEVQKCNGLLDKRVLLRLYST
jgi:hypothetical protein